ncbi:hypothetical protein OMP38_24435 [Cohnella ginsengisoli]|uniref:DUF4352 domain-containing protein n=1 Tax=Cohnella ginsengisoli TaxID=425004 RepID=A0A9X4QNR5_9BACL|nr:hypothetical protein [Cohnella ginsengisoli]MDG0793624.1 hypothetical protein [Cohnella ginsengisoli]
MMNRNNWLYAAAIAALLMTSACGEKTNDDAQASAGAPSSAAQATPLPSASASLPASAPASPSAGEATDAPASSQGASAEGSGAAASGEPADQKILIVIDQTEKPIEGNSFDFAVKQVPSGYALSEMSWTSGDTKIVNTLQDAIAHGGNGEDGFYISGDGQFMGFFYPDELKGQEGEVSFLFKDDNGQEKRWTKKIKLK